MCTPAPTHNIPPYSVSEIAGAVKRAVEDNFGHVRVRGEISGFKRHSSGHLYFSLKDDKAVLNGICWRNTAEKLSMTPEDGLEVICAGRLTTYPGRSQYQLVVTEIIPAGAGALMALLEKRKQALAAEGLFDESRKQALPFMPQVVGVITSPTGAVIKDILHRIADRFPVHVLVWPVAVQGEDAAGQITHAIQGFNAVTGEGTTPRPDLLIVARGGGSVEDLWPFNEEPVVRAVANSAIPIISAVGHETDTTLIDYVADQRAPTPTAAAEMAVPVRDEWLLSLGDQRQRLNRGIRRLIEQHAMQLQAAARGLPKPAQIIDHAAQRLDDWQERLSTALPALLSRKHQQLGTLLGALRPTILLRDIRHEHKSLQTYHTRMKHQLHAVLQQHSDHLESAHRLLESYHYRNVLKRGFVAVKDSKNTPLTAAGQTHAGQHIHLEFHDGTRRAHITGGAPSDKRASSTHKSKPSDKQQTLFDS